MDTWYKERTDRLENQLDEIQRLVADIDKTLVLNTAMLEQHMKHTATLEAELEPIKDQVRLTRTLLLMIVAGIGLLGTITGIFSDLKILK